MVLNLESLKKNKNYTSYFTLPVVSGIRLREIIKEEMLQSGEQHFDPAAA
jgi:hypothetical protein